MRSLDFTQDKASLPSFQGPVPLVPVTLNPNLYYVLLCRKIKLAAITVTVDIVRPQRVSRAGWHDQTRMGWDYPPSTGTITDLILVTGAFLGQSGMTTVRFPDGASRGFLL